MKKMKTTIAAAVALAACAGTQVFAGIKEGNITFALTEQGQKSVSTSASALNAGLFSDGPGYYKTGSAKITQKDLINDIGHVLGVSFSSKAQLVLVQGELSGFFNVVDSIDTALPNDATVTVGHLDGTYTDSLSVDQTDIPNGLTVGALSNGRHFQLNPNTGASPVGHFQPWGQIFIKDAGYSGYTASAPLYINVTYFFRLKVHECYDCYYLNSFISDSSFSSKSTANKWPNPACCGVSSTTYGKGTDKYYLTLGFDDTVVNPYLNSNNVVNGTSAVGYTDGGGNFVGYYVGHQGIKLTGVQTNEYGILPDSLPYEDTIASGIAKSSPYLARFELNGILTYNWTLKILDSSEAIPDFIGTAGYSANGYGFIQLTCMLLTGTASISETLVKTSPWATYSVAWSDSWYGIGWDQDLANVVDETDAPGISGLNATTQENTSLNLTTHTTDWVPNGVTYYYPNVSVLF